MPTLDVPEQGLLTYPLRLPHLLRLLPLMTTAVSAQGELPEEYSAPE